MTWMIYLGYRTFRKPPLCNKINRDLLDIEKGIFIGNIMKYRKLGFKPTRLITINYIYTVYI